MIFVKKIYRAIFHSLFIFTPGFPMERVAGAAAVGGLSHGFQQSLTVLLAPHQLGTKIGRKYNQSTWSLINLWAAFPWV